jgi:hypothetical protein
MIEELNFEWVQLRNTYARKGIPEGWGAAHIQNSNFFGIFG